MMLNRSGENRCLICNPREKNLSVFSLVSLLGLLIKFYYILLIIIVK